MQWFKEEIRRIIDKNANRGREMGLSIVLIILLVVFFKNYHQLVPLAIIILMLTIIIPNIFFPIGILWFGLFRIIGGATSSLILILLFFAVVTPVGLWRRLIRIDVLRLKQWKKNNASAFMPRYDRFSDRDLENTY